jgi:hypothetical protein
MTPALVRPCNRSWTRWWEQGEKAALIALTKKAQECWSYRELGDQARSFANAAGPFERGDGMRSFMQVLGTRDECGA